MRSLCRALLVLNVLYCVLAVLQPGLPGWHMFEAVEPIDYQLRDRDGRDLDVFDWLPRRANLVDRDELRRIVAFVCARELARGPFLYVEPSRGVRTTLAAHGDPKECIIHAPR